MLGRKRSPTVWSVIGLQVPRSRPYAPAIVATIQPNRAAAPLFEVTAPVRIEGESNAQTIFTWMVANRYLWMLHGEWADRVEDLVGTARLIRLAGRQLRFRRENPMHDALEVPTEGSAREFAYTRLARFLEMHIVLDDVVNASRETPFPPSPRIGTLRNGS
jgi:hypothetical protein